MFKVRNGIVHSMELVQLTPNEVRSLCSNTLNYIEQASILLTEIDALEWLQAQIVVMTLGIGRNKNDESNAALGI